MARITGVGRSERHSASLFVARERSGPLGLEALRLGRQGGLHCAEEPWGSAARSCRWDCVPGDEGERSPLRKSL